MNLAIKHLGKLIEKYGMVEYIRDRYAAVNGRLKMLYTNINFCITAIRQIRKGI